MEVNSKEKQKAGQGAGSVVTSRVVNKGRPLCSVGKGTLPLREGEESTTIPGPPDPL